jgi:hypothetical protein
MRSTATALGTARDEDLQRIGLRLGEGIEHLESATRWIVSHYEDETLEVLAGSVYYLKLAGTVAGGWMMARSAEVAARRQSAGEGEAEFLSAKRATARFYAEHVLPQSDWLAQALIEGGTSVAEADAVFSS